VWKHIHKSNINTSKWNVAIMITWYACESKRVNDCNYDNDYECVEPHTFKIYRRSVNPTAQFS